ncbi:SAM-dependent methyltransferase [Planococcus salinus]|uniref:SAM-dependent methyltransferase n=1 Tax=Planococcus salinus TaxID=1848460 RepID=A0A3M8P7T0_9BACL|nr:SAM-dependent methyltransferase [Planococcus salinus]RNF39713.1 SAM-dependent methyltransferase [Planococcus salinus]
MRDRQYDELLNIATTKEQHGFNDSPHFHRYEATPYELLDRLFAVYPLDSSDRLIDFGCGKGRLNFYAHHLFGTGGTGVEMSEAFFKQALKNRERYGKKHKGANREIEFECGLAQSYEIKPQDNKFYFFNPFSVQIFMTVVNKILRSAETEPRQVDLILFFPSADYTDYLERQTQFELFQEVVLPGAEKEPRERFLVYRLS